MKLNNKFVFLVSAVLCLSMTACGTSGKATVPDTGASETSIPTESTVPSESVAPAATEISAVDDVEISAENQVLINDTLQAIYDVHPGSSGCSLRAMAAAARLLDLAETLTDRSDASELTRIAYEWKQNNDKIEGAFDEAYMDVREIAFDYLNHPDAYKGQLEDCGYVFTHDTHTPSYLEYVTNYLEISRATGE